MRLRHRASSASDFHAWVRHSNVRSRYGETFPGLAAVWANLLNAGCANSSVVEDLDAAPGDALRGIGVSVFLNDEFLQYVKSSPFFWIGPELIRRISRKESPVLDAAAIRHANSNDGLNLFIWEADARPLSEKGFLAFSSEISTGFFEQHLGYNIKEVIGQQPFGRALRGALQVGGWLLRNGDGRYAPAKDIDALEKSGAPFVLGMTRELAASVPGSWLSTLFYYERPRIFFTPGEQRLLACALGDQTDDEIADTTGLSVSAVKKCWQAIYSRAGCRMPELLPDESYDGGRGAEKKRRLLAYVRSHPEELRPVMPPSARRNH
jgi:hypothetical protein